MVSAGGDLLSALTPVVEVLDDLEVAYQVGDPWRVRCTAWREPRWTSISLRSWTQATWSGLSPGWRRPYDQEALARRKADRLEESDDAREFFVATAEDVILTKLEWFEREERTSGRQWTDVLGVLRVQGDSMDVEYLRRWAAELGIADLLMRGLSER